MKKKICIVIGARPEMIRFSLIVKELKNRDNAELLLIHTGQHYSHEMSDTFLKEFKFPKPHKNFMVGHLNPSEQIGQLIIKTGEYLQKEQPNVVCVWGDTNSSLGLALAANKNNIPLCHIEAGCRSHDFRMPEEYNRIMIDHMSNFMFPVSLNDQQTIKKEKIHGKSFFLGDPLYDVFLLHQRLIRKMNKEKMYKDTRTILLTLHRAENVDNPITLQNILVELSHIVDSTIIFPVHPRTQKMIKRFGLSKLLHKENIKIIPPIGYFDLLILLNQCNLVITDSGGLQKEAFFAKKLCLTLRKSSEWSDTITLGSNILLDPQTKALQKISYYSKEAPNINKKIANIKKSPYGRGDASKKIVDTILKEVC